MRNVRRNRIIGIIMLCLVSIGTIACGSVKTNNDITVSEEETEVIPTENNDRVDIIEEEANRKGNSNGNIVNGGQVAKKDDWIYYGLSDGLYKCKEDGTEKEKLFSISNGGGVYDINVIDDNIYYGGWGIYKIKTDGTGYKEIASEEVTGATHIIGDYIYKGNQFKMKNDGTELQQIYDRNCASGYTVNVVDGWTYFFDRDAEKNDGIYKMKQDGTELTKIFDGGSSYLIVEDNWIYFHNLEDNSYLYKMNTNGEEIQKLDEARIMGINVNDGWIYYNGKNALSKMKVDGTEKQILCEDNAVNIHIFDEWIYYWINGDETLYRIKIDGTERQVFATPE